MKKNKVFWLFAVCLLMITTGIVTKTFQNDTFFTIPTGNYILENGVNDVEPFTWHENLKFTKLRWAFDITVAKIYQIAGFSGLYVFTIIIAFLIAFTIFTTLSKNRTNKLIAFLMAIFTLIALSGFITCRGQLISYLLFALESYCVYKLAETNKGKYSIYLIVISTLLVCFHSSVWLVYFLFFVPYIIEGIITKFKLNNIFEKSDKIIFEPHLNKKLIITMCISFVLGLLSPLGTTPLTYMFKVVGGLSSKIILELQPVTIEENLNLCLILAVIIVVLAFTKTKIRFTDICLIVGFFIMAKLAERNVGIVLVSIALPIANLVNSFIKEYNKEFVFEYVNKIINKISCLIIIFLACFLIMVTNYLEIKNQPYVDQTRYPIEATEYIKENIDLNKMKIYNHFNFGSYMEFKGVPTFMDSRSEVYCEEFNNVTILNDFADLEIYKVITIDDMVEKYGITHVISYSGSHYIDYMKNSDNYEVVYEDLYFIVFEVVANGDGAI